MSHSYYTNNNLWLKTQYHIQTHRHDNIMYKTITVLIVHYGALILQKSQLILSTILQFHYEDMRSWDCYIPMSPHTLKFDLYIMHKIHF